MSMAGSISSDNPSRHSRTASTTASNSSRRKADTNVEGAHHRSPSSSQPSSAPASPEDRSPSSKANMEPHHQQKPSMSIDQSVRVFRVFEILRSGDTTAIAKTIKECADPQSEPLGTTVLHLAIQCTEPQIVEYVLSYDSDIDINAQDRDGNTPLHLAAQLGRLSIVRDLLD
ncbi:hypothetical protein KEM54_002738, partial [Ascosphaera aggregata]